MSDEGNEQILVIEDDPDAAANLVDILELDQFEVWTAASSAEAQEKIGLHPYFAVIVDRQLPDGRLDELLPTLKAAAPDAAFIVVTGYADIDGAIAALRQGADDYILKPLNPDALRNTLHRLLERRRLSIEKARSEAAFRHLVEAAECLIILLTTDGRILYFSPCGERTTGDTNEALAGRDFAERMLPPRERVAFRDLLERVVSGESIRGRETSLICRQGTTRALLWNLRRVDDYLEEPAVLLVGQDITDLKHAQDQALRAERLAAIGQMVAGLAHESRNALQRSQSCLEMLTLVVDDRPAALDYIARIQKAQDDLTRLHEDVRSYAAPIKLECHPCRLDEIWREAWSQIELLKPKSRFGLIEQIQDVEVVSVVADAFRLGQMFRNIFDNALAATHSEGKVAVSVAPAEIDGKPAVEIRINDDGPGLTCEQRIRIFETFYTTKTKGTGLGLPICKRIVEAHGGTIVAGGGSRLGPTGAEIIVLLPRGIS